MKVCISGISGRMGTEVKKVLGEKQISGGISLKTNKNEMEEMIKNSDVVVDFSSVENALSVAELCHNLKVPMICGTTGFSQSEMLQLKSYSEKIAMLYASNFSIGIYLMGQLLKFAEKVLDDYDISIIDRHHNKKKDAPSGTTLFLASQMEKDSQIVSIRAGGISGDHICSFTGENEELVISHRSFSRGLFASGAVKCAEWIVNQKPGFYSLGDYLNDKK